MRRICIARSYSLSVQFREVAARDETSKPNVTVTMLPPLSPPYIV